jgi:hypothetical protein
MSVVLVGGISMYDDVLLRILYPRDPPLNWRFRGWTGLCGM